MGPAIENRLRKLETMTRQPSASVVVVAADREEADRRLAELSLDPGKTSVILTGVRRALIEARSNEPGQP